MLKVPEHNEGLMSVTETVRFSQCDGGSVGFSRLFQCDGGFGGASQGAAIGVGPGDQRPARPHRCRQVQHHPQRREDREDARHCLQVLIAHA